MKQYLEIKNDYELKQAIQQLERHDKLAYFVAPAKVEDESRTIVHIDIRGSQDVIFSVEGRYDLMQSLLDKINEARLKHNNPKA